MKRKQFFFSIGAALAVLVFVSQTAPAQDAKNETKARNPTPTSAVALDEMSLTAIEKRIKESTTNEKDLAELSRLVEAQPGNVQANYVLAQYFELKGFEQLAIEALDRAIKSDPNFGSAHYRRCQIYLRMNEQQQALKDADACAKLLAKDGEKLFQLGLSFDRTGQHERAKQFFALSAKAGRKGEGFGANLAQIRMAHKKFDEALEAVEWDLKTNPDDSRALIIKAEVLSKMGRVEDAVQCYLTAARTAPCEQLAAQTATRQLLTMKRDKEALETALLDLLCMKKQNKDMEASKQVVFDLLQRIPDTDSEKVVLSSSVQVDKSWRCRFFRLALGDIFDRLGRPTRAIAQYQLGLHNCPAQISDTLTHARGLYRLGRDYELHFRNYREALDLYRRASALAPQDEEITRNYVRLSRKIKNRKNDLAWKIKDAWYSFWQAFSPVQP